MNHLKSNRKNQCAMNLPSLEAECDMGTGRRSPTRHDSSGVTQRAGSGAGAPNRACRVAHVLRKFDPAEWGGTETAIQRLFEGLNRHRVDSVMFCPRLPDPLPREPLAGEGCGVRRFRAFLPILGISPERRRQMIAVGGNLMSF